MKILQISNYYAPELGGIEKIAQAISLSVVEKDKIRVVCFTHKKTDKIDEVDGVRVRRIGSQINIASQQLSVYAYGIIKEEIQTFVPDVIIIHVPNPFLSAILLKLIPENAKLIVYWHSDIVKQKLGEKLFHTLTIHLLNRAKVIVATSPNYIDGSKYLSLYRKKCIVIPNCIEDETLIIDEKTARIAKEIDEKYRNKTLCVCVGRQVPYKGFEYAVEAIKLLDDSFQLVIIGRQGESTTKIKQLSENKNNIVMIGEADFSTLKAYLFSCDIFCFPSITKNEAFGIALAEGMYFNKPAVTFTIPGSGVNYVSLNGITGIEVPNRDVKSYAEALKKLADSPFLCKQYGKAAGERVRGLFLLSQFKISIEKLLTKI